MNRSVMCVLIEYIFTIKYKSDLLRFYFLLQFVSILYVCFNPGLGFYFELSSLIVVSEGCIAMAMKFKKQLIQL